MSESQPQYELALDDEHWEILESWGERRLEEVLAFLRDHASRTPTVRIPGKLKQLKEQWRGYYQYTVDNSHKLIYRVDEDAKRVLVEYVGPHPNWARSRRGRIRS